MAEHGVVQAFFDGVVRQAMDAGLCSDDHFSVDRTLIQRHASLTSLVPIAGLRRTKLVGRWKIRLHMTNGAAAYNLIRMTKLAPT